MGLEGGSKRKQKLHNLEFHDLNFLPHAGASDQRERHGRGMRQ